MATAERPRAWPKAKDSLEEALKQIIEVADQETREDQAELQQLRMQSFKVDDLQHENERLRLQLETALKDLEKRKPDARVIPASDDESSEAGSPLKRATEPQSEDDRQPEGLQTVPRKYTPELFSRVRGSSWGREFQGWRPKVTEEEFPDKIPLDWSDKEAVEIYNRLAPKFKEVSQKYEILRAESKEVHQSGNETSEFHPGDNELQTLQQKYNELETKHKNLKKNHDSLSNVRTHMEHELRKKKKSIEGWMVYANHMDKKNKKLNAELSACPHRHAIVSKKSRSLGLPSNKGQGKNSTSAEYVESDDETTLRPPSDVFTSPLAPSKASSPIARVFTSRLERLRHSSPDLPESSKIFEEASRDVRRGLLTVPDDTSEDQQLRSSPRLQNELSPRRFQVVVPRSPEYRSDEDLPDDHQSLLNFNEVEQELPKLDDGNRNADTNETAHTSSTQGEPYPTQKPLAAEVPIIEQGGSSPLFLRDMVVKKSKAKRKIADNTETVYVKYEEATSSPIGLVNIDYGESMDLDDHPHMVTPRKKRSARPTSYKASQLGRSMNQDDSRAATPNEVPASGKILVERSPDRPSRSISPDKPNNSTALQPLNSNKKLLQQDGQPPQKRRRRNAATEVSSVTFASVSGNRENIENQIQKHKEQNGQEPLIENSTPRNRLINPELISRSVNTIQQHGRTSSTSTKPISRPTSSRAGSTARDVLPVTRVSKLQISPKRGSPRNMGTPKIASSGDMWEPPSSSPQPEGQPATLRLSKYSKRDTPTSRNENSANHQTGPLRYRPIDTLRIDSFKINPNYMPGHNHAYADVVRNQAERRCLPGCERECCGPRFRKLAEMMLTARISGQLSESTRRSDERALQNYMGDDFLKYERLSKEHQRDILIKALGRQLSTDHGSHKHVYERMNSPPGFWDMDFPETQEILANREKARLEERKLVEERYRDAVRPGGRYMFRDEFS